MTPKTVSDWLIYMGNIHKSAIDMGLERVSPAFEKLGIKEKIKQNQSFVFTVAGTNGKGSTTATIAQICQNTQKKVGLYQSPHLVSFNERIMINGQMVNDEQLVQAFQKVEEVRTELGLSLSFFEMTTLSAFILFAENACDIWVLEIGLGGRLDVVNLVEPNLCVITNVAIDHTDWLGDTREKIGFEKAGILRKNSTLIYGEEDMPASVAQSIHELSVQCHQYKKDFAVFDNDDNTWQYSSAGVTLTLPKPTLALQNVAIGISAVLASGLDIPTQAIINGVASVKLAGRLDLRVIHNKTWLFDVAHNKAGVEFLLKGFCPIWTDFQKNNPNANLHFVFSMLGDKDIASVLDLVFGFAQDNNLPVKTMTIAPLDNPRTMSRDELWAATTSHITNKSLSFELNAYDNMAQAIQGIDNHQQIKQGDFLLVFGSFHTIGESLLALGQYPDFKVT